jgi:threonine/homoserine/homoserine lactone efflux protein
MARPRQRGKKRLTLLRIRPLLSPHAVCGPVGRALALGRVPALATVVGNAAGIFVQGILFAVGVTNPKVVVIFTAVVPPFVDRSAGDVTAQLLVLSAIAVGIALVTDSLWVLAAGAARSWFARRPQRADHLGGIGGAMMLAVGVKIAVAP